LWAFCNYYPFVSLHFYSNLRAHVQTHSTTKPYVCQRCGKAFALKSYLYKHEESSCMRLHRHSGHGQQRSVMPLFDESSRSSTIVWTNSLKIRHFPFHMNLPDCIFLNVPKHSFIENQIHFLDPNLKQN